jgi:2-oxoglutarate ferredoxin oxidoreductase subunit alpha
VNAPLRPETARAAVVAKPLASVNDFVVKFANVNGSGSASANELFAKAILRMGVPVSPRNIFPSNIQGLPTWYEVRVCERGWLGRRGGVDMMVAMNPQTWERDLKEIEPGGYLLYDSSRHVPPERLREDVVALGLPLTEICNATYGDARERQLMKNILCLGALSVLLGIDPAEIETLFGEQYKGKERLLDANVKALHLGREHARATLAPIGLRVERRDAVGRPDLHGGQRGGGAGRGLRRRERLRVVSDHAELVGGRGVRVVVREAAHRAGDRTLALRDRAGRGRARLDRHGGRRRLERRARVHRHQRARRVADDRVHRPGLLRRDPGHDRERAARRARRPACHAHPAGRPARLRASRRTATPSTRCCSRGRAECFESHAAALDLADRLQTPVFVMTDLDIGMNTRLCRPLSWDPSRALDRGKVMDHDVLESGRDFGRYLDVDGDGIPYRTYPATHPTRGAFFTRGTTRNPYAKYSEAGADYVYNMERLMRKWETAKALVPQPVVRKGRKRTSIGAIYFGSTSPAMDEALEVLDEHGVAIDTMRLRAFPFPESVRDFVDAHDTVFVVEQNRDAQMKSLLVNELQVDPGRFVSVLHYDGTPITARFIIGRITAASHGAGRAARRSSSAATTDRLLWKRPRHDLHRQAQAPPSDARPQQGRLPAPRLRGRDLDALRGVRPRLDLGGDRAGVLGARHRAASRRQALGHRLLEQDARLLPRQFARVQQRARPDAVGADRREPREPGAAVPGVSGRRRLGVDRPRASSRT